MFYWWVLLVFFKWAFFKNPGGFFWPFFLQQPWVTNTLLPALIRLVFFYQTYWFWKLFLDLGIFDNLAMCFKWFPFFGSQQQFLNKNFLWKSARFCLDLMWCWKKNTAMRKQQAKTRQPRKVEWSTQTDKPISVEAECAFSVIASFPN